MNNSKDNHLQSITHKMLSESNMRRYITQNPNINDIEEKMRNILISRIKNDERFLVSYVIKLFTTTNRVT